MEQLHWQAAGVGEPILLLHGMYHSSFSFRHNMDALAQWGKVYALDLPGHGASPVSERPLTNPELAGLLLRFMDEQQIEKACVIGSSAAAAIVLRLSAERPDRVRGVVAINGSPLPLKPHLTGTLLRWFLSAQVDAALGTRFSGSAWRSYFPGLYSRRERLTPEEKERIGAAGCRAGIAAAALGMLKGFGDLSDRLTDVRVPVLLVWGDMDPEFSLNDAERLRATIPDAQLRIVPGTGHYPHEEDPEAFHKIMRDWLQDLGTVP